MFRKKESQALTLRERHYKYVLDEDFKYYDAFISKRIYETAVIKGHEVRYIEMGSGPLLLMLPGSTGKAMSFYEYIEGLSTEFRTVAIDYPVVESLDEMRAVLIEFTQFILKQGERAYIVANSFGTVILQEVLIERPDLFEQIYFVHGMSKDKSISKKTIQLHQRSIKSFLKSVTFLNYDRFQKRFSKRIRKSIDICPDNISRRLFWEGFFEEMIYSTTQSEMISNYKFIKDFWDHRVYDTTMFESVTQPVFIIESFRDMEAELPEKLALCSLFKTSELFKLSGDANLSLIKNRDAIIQFIVEKKLEHMANQNV
ncbi:alpha/beta fold hydrolase [Fusibacter ferrireducens]|uniref:Alpha/beta hydrolase n=1 Tax=Fusibacter ferrireducens TaxID=2785058 RepID=A0ABR9ZUG0_9FIRM|nr:alpha/beta hydrolase [Fusibacter ferrireducens]MBF4694117.1 alpha/beta hydrolase [Fusibacter ferrireducens]